MNTWIRFIQAFAAGGLVGLFSTSWIQAFVGTSFLVVVIVTSDYLYGRA